MRRERVAHGRGKIFMTGRVLVDTNILVYAHDPSEEARNRKAIGLLDELKAAGTGVLSTQVLMEFVRAVTAKIPQPMSMKAASSQARLFMAAWPVLPVTRFTVDEALRGAMAHKMSLWDAQVWATARMNQVPTVLSEDFGHGTEIDGVRFRNPFLE